MTLADQAAEREAATFVAREGELAALAGFLALTSPHRLAFVTGAAGIGKTALLREAVRRSTQYHPFWVDARELTGQHSLDALLTAASTQGRPLIVIDSAEELAGQESWLREEGLDNLPDAARIVLATRHPLEAAWWGSAWAASIVTVPVSPLATGAAAAFLAARGIDGVHETADVVGWAEGHPLSLTLAAAVRGSRGRRLDAADLAALETDLLDQLTGGCLADPDVVGSDRLVLAVAAVAPAVDADLLDAVLPGRRGAAAERWLRSLPFAERLGHRVTLHQRVRRLLAAELRNAEPDVERDLRLRIIDHLTDPRHRTRSQLVIEVREVLAPPQDRGVAPSRARSSPWRVTDATIDDVAAVAALLVDQDTDYAAWVLRWVTEAPDHVLVARDPLTPRQVVAVSIWVTSASVPDGFREDPVLAPWWEAERSWTGDSLLQPVTEIAVVEGDLPELSALLQSAVVQRCGLDDFRRWVVPRKPPAPDPTHCGGVRDATLDLVVGGLRVPVHVIDYGPAGIISAMAAQARAALVDQALVLPSAQRDPVADVRHALRHVHDPVVLAASPLAVGLDPATRAASVTALLRDGVATAFGEGADARLQRDVLQRGYLDADANHTRAMHALHLSRTTYFRRLREATATLAAWLSASMPA